MCVWDYNGLLHIHVCKLMIFTVATQEAPGIVIAHPGQDVELLCTVTVTSTNETVAWLVNGIPYTSNSLRNGILPEYSANGSNLIVEDIMINDHRSGSEYSCVVVLQGTIQRQSNQTTLFVVGECALFHCTYVYIKSIAYVTIIVFQ